MSEKVKSKRKEERKEICRTDSNSWSVKVTIITKNSSYLAWVAQTLVIIIIHQTADSLILWDIPGICEWEFNKWLLSQYSKTQCDI